MRLRNTSLFPPSAEKSEKLSGTPSTAHYDSMGREVYKLSTDGIHQTTVYDKFGNVERIIDSRDNTVVINRYDMLGNVISIKGMDVGTKWKLMDATGNIMTTWDQRGHIYERHYDVMGRPIWSAVKGGEEKNLNNIVSRSIYGEDLLLNGYPKEELKRKNYLGKIIYEYDTSGRSSVDMYDFAGRALKCRFQLASDYKCVVNWTEEGTDNGLEEQEFITLHKYDALGRNIQSVNPDGSVISVAYGRGGMPMIQSMAKSADQTPKLYIKSLSVLIQVMVTSELSLMMTKTVFFSIFLSVTSGNLLPVHIKMAESRLSVISESGILI